MKPILIIGPGTSEMNYTVEPMAGRVVVTCPACGATVTAVGTVRRRVTAVIKHEPDCEWHASLERSASFSRKDARRGSVH